MRFTASRKYLVSSLDIRARDTDNVCSKIRQVRFEESGPALRGVRTFSWTV